MNRSQLLQMLATAPLAPIAVVNKPLPKLGEKITLAPGEVRCIPPPAIFDQMLELYRQCALPDHTLRFTIVPRDLYKGIGRPAGGRSTAS